MQKKADKKNICPEPGLFGRKENPEVYSFKEELANSLTHGLGIALSLLGTGLMAAKAAASPAPLNLFAALVFGISMCLLYTASTLYHSSGKPSTKKTFKILDPAGIYLLIAGSYTPFSLLAFSGFWKWGLFSVIWTIALFGVFFKIFFTGRFRKLSLALYLGMGWLAIFALPEMLNRLLENCLALLLLGGLSYTCGVIFYIQKKKAYTHAVWHFFVLLGSLFHFLAVYLFLL